jgi:hypothetical protein
VSSYSHYIFITKYFLKIIWKKYFKLNAKGIFWTDSKEMSWNNSKRIPKEYYIIIWTKSSKVI